MSNKRKVTIDIPNDMDKKIQRLSEEETEGKYNPMTRKLLTEALKKRK